MVYINPTVSITTLNVNGLNTPIKRDKKSRLKNKTHLYIIYMKPSLNIKSQIDIKRKGIKIYHANTIQRKM